MKRRTLFGAALGAVAALVFPRRAKAEFDPTKADRDREGNAVCRVYRLADDGRYYEIDRAAIEPGDRIVMIGQDGARLWKCEVATVAAVDPDCCPAGGFIEDADKGTQDLLDIECDRQQGTAP